MKIPFKGKANSHERKNQKYLRFISQLPCVCTGSTHNIIAHHLLRGVNRGMGMKARDSDTIPLMHDIHMALHQNGNETEYLAGWGISDPVDLAAKLYAFGKVNDIEGATKYIYDLLEANNVSGAFSD